MQDDDIIAILSKDSGCELDEIMEFHVRRKGWGRVRRAFAKTFSNPLKKLKRLEELRLVRSEQVIRLVPATGVVKCYSLTIQGHSRKIELKKREQRNSRKRA